MGVIEDLAERVTMLERDREEHRGLHKHLDNHLGLFANVLTETRGQVALLTRDMAEVKTDVAVLKTDMAEVKSELAEVKDDVAILKTDMAEVKANTADLGEIRARVAVIPELQAGQLEIRDMLAKLLAQSEIGAGR